MRTPKIKILLFAAACAWTFGAYNAYGDDRVVIQSASVDWEAVSGRRLSEYKITFADADVADRGWELYFLDAFPCFGSAQYVRTWISKSSGGSDAFVRAYCLAKPKEIRLAWRPAAKDDRQAKTTGILKCAVDKNLTVRLGGCEKQTWAEWEKE